jgi:hypothetical protein
VRMEHILEAIDAEHRRVSPSAYSDPVAAGRKGHD